MKKLLAGFAALALFASVGATQSTAQGTTQFRMRVRNNTQSQLIVIQVRARADDGNGGYSYSNWSEDLMNGAVIEPGALRMVPVGNVDACTFEVRFMTVDSSDFEDSGEHDVCSAEAPDVLIG